MKNPKDTSSEFVFVASKIPTDPGCYLFYDKDDRLLYVGKAKQLRKRVKSYFQKTNKAQRTQVMVKKICKIETRIVHSDMEALILENNLIKEFQPRYNVLLRDDKSFLYLRITDEPLPKIEITRRIVRDNAFYFGPKTSSRAFRSTINFCQKVFGIRTCKLQMQLRDGVTEVTKNPENRKLPCMDFHVKKCTGPCSGDISPQDYRQQVELMKKFLRGDTKDVQKSLEDTMLGFAESKNFEAASKIRDLLQSIEHSTQKQNVELQDRVSRDFLHYFEGKKSVYFVRIAFRNGKFIDQTEIELSKGDNDDPAIWCEQCITQLYPRIDTVPKEIAVPVELPNQTDIEVFLMSLADDDWKREIIMPQKGDKKRVLEIAEKNARHYGQKQEISHLSQAETFSKALPELAKYLDMPEPPRRMECYDISHLGGTATVASQVVFVDGEPKKSEYRRFKVKTLTDGQIDDFAAMNEILGRRFARKDDTKFAEKFPDLIVIDGGKGQLSSVMKAVEYFAESQIFPENFDPYTQIISLAKKEELIYKPNQKEPIEIPFESPALKLLQRIRDEAHRFAITFNRVTRQKKMIRSVLDEIPGIGGKTKKALLERFDTVSGIRKATDEELLTVVSHKQCEALRKNL